MLEVLRQIYSKHNGRNVRVTCLSVRRETQQIPKSRKETVPCVSHNMSLTEIWLHDNPKL